MYRRARSSTILKAPTSSWPRKMMRDRCCIRGNVPMSVLTVGTPDDVKAYCKKLIDVCAVDGGFHHGRSGASYRMQDLKTCKPCSISPRTTAHASDIHVYTLRQAFGIRIPGRIFFSTDLSAGFVFAIDQIFTSQRTGWRDKDGPCFRRPFSMQFLV